MHLLFGVEDLPSVIKSRLFFTTGEIYYDEVQQRVAYILLDNEGQSSEKLHIIALYKEDLIYTINLETETCAVQKLGRTFIPIQVPVNATFVGDTILGTSDLNLGDGVEVETWQGKFTDPNGFYQVVVTRRGCIPLNSLFVSDEIGTVETFFSNIVGGISDPNVFVPPGACTAS
jgi:hypothetical protein